MEGRTIQISLPVEACEFALRGAVLDGSGQPSLLRDTRAALGRAPKNPAGSPFCDGHFTPEQARDLYDYFHSAAYRLATRNRDGALACANARDNARRALQAAGIAIPQ